MNPLAGITIVIESEEPLTEKTNKANRDNVIANWSFGPEETTSDNKDYWRQMAKIWLAVNCAQTVSISTTLQNQWR